MSGYNLIAAAQKASSNAKKSEEAPKDLLLMSKDKLVMRINLSTGKFEVANESLLPYSLRNKFRQVLSYEQIKSKYEDTQRQIAIDKNKEVLTSWLANRVLSLSRKNAKWIYNLLKFEQLSSNYEKAKVALVCRAVSLLDCYWVKMDGDSATWDSVNLRTNHLNEVIAQVALHGSSLSLQGSLTTPELTTHGAYAKAWRRHDDGSLWLYKKGNDGNTESRIEVMVSNLLDKTNAVHCHYEAGEDNGHYVCMCPCMTTEDIGILDGGQFYSYCISHNLNPDKEMINIDANGIYTMWVVDYLIANRDRHGQNWGFFYDLNTMEVLGTHPLYDHNNAFDIEWINNPNADYQFCDMTIREAAHYAIKRCDFKIIEPITREDFITDRQYNCFMSRAKELGLL